MRPQGDTPTTTPRTLLLAALLVLSTLAGAAGNVAALTGSETIAGSSITATSATVTATNLDVNDTYQWYVFTYYPSGSLHSTDSGIWNSPNSSTMTDTATWSRSNQNGTHSISFRLYDYWGGTLLDTWNSTFQSTISNLTADANEPNDSDSAATSIATNSTQSGVNIHNASDDDWYTFSVNNGTMTHVNLTHTHSEANLQLSVYYRNSIGNRVLLGNSHSSTDDEQVVFNASTTLTILVWVFSSGGAANYSLTTHTGNIPGSTGLSADANEPNDAIGNATSVSVPSSQTGLTIHNSTDDDWFSFSAVAGSTYWVNITFAHSAGDIDLRLYDSSGTTVDTSMSSTSDESVSATPTSNMTLSAEVFGWSGATNTYSIQIASSSGGSTATGTEFVNITSISETHGAWIFGNLSSSSTYEFDWYWTYWNGTNHSAQQQGVTSVSSTSGSNNVSHDPPAWAGTWCFFAILWEQVGLNWNYVTEDGECLYHQIGVINVTSDTSGWITTENLTVGSTYTMHWYVTDSTWQTIHDQANYTFTPTTSTGVQTNDSIGFNNSGPGVDHCFIAEIVNSSSIIIERVSECWTTQVTPPASGDLTVTGLNDTASIHEADNLSIGTNYSILAEHTYWNGTGHNLLGWAYDPWQANQTTHELQLTMTAYEIAGTYCVSGYLYDEDHSANGTMIDSDMDCWQRWFADVSATSDGGGTVDLSNLTDGATYRIDWWLFDGAGPSYSDSGVVNVTMPSGGATSQAINWTMPTTSDQRCFAAEVSNSSGYLVDSDYDCFVPTLPQVWISTLTNSSVAFWAENLTVGDSYGWTAEVVHGSNNTTYAQSGAQSFIAGSTLVANNWSWTMPTASGGYCIEVVLEDSQGNALDLDSDCFSVIHDADGDGIWDENDLCPNTPVGSTVDMNGCADSQRDTDGDGYTDDVDAFTNDSTQWADTDGDGYGDNASGNNGDAFPTDATQWADRDGDGHGDNASGNSADAFPDDPDQWSDADGDGWGDEPGHNTSDAFPNDPTQWTDQDGDGYGDNPNGFDPDAFPTEPSQWADRDGDGYGDNATGVNADAFPDDASQWVDRDGDGYGDNASGTDPDAFPDESSQWSDRDGDGYGDNASGTSPDHCPDSPASAQVDQNGCAESEKDDDMDLVMNDVDACPGTPAGESVDAAGCSDSQKDSDRDGVADAFDLCPGSALGDEVDSAGCAAWQRDTDGDSVNDDRDRCNDTAPEAVVDGYGCSADQRDGDEDGVSDAVDMCWNTPTGAEVNSVGCAASERDLDEDGLTDDLDLCPFTPANSTIDSDGCAKSQLDSDGDTVSDADDLCSRTPENESVDPKGCSMSQVDSDDDGVSDAVDQCRNTPMGEQVDLSTGCPPDEDGDGVRDSDDDCRATPADETVDDSGCAKSQLDGDEDRVMDDVDQCTSTPASERTKVDANGCGPSERDLDDDGVVDSEDAFPEDANESVDSDGDGVGDNADAYPEDAQASVAGELDSGMMLQVIIGLVVLALLAGIGTFVLRGRKDGGTTADDDPYAADVAFDSMAYADAGVKARADPIAAIAEPQQWTDADGNHWTQQPDGTILRWNGVEWEHYS